jgi:hypothetical protein
VNGSENAWTPCEAAPNMSGVPPAPFERLLRLAAFVAVLATGTALFAATTPAPAAQPPGTAARDWKQPVDWYPTSVRRWFAGLPRELQYSEVRFLHGDDPQWARPEWDDSGWVATGFWDLPARSGIDWMRMRVRMGPNGRTPLPAGIMISTVRAYDLFWDGVQLGNCGHPGNTASAEIPGHVDEWFSIPAALTGPGEHLVALRSSSYRCGFPAATSGFRFLVDAPAVLHGKVLREALLPTLAAGALFMTALASMIMWLLAARRPTLLLLFGVCLCGAVMQGLQAARWFFVYPADWHYPVLSAMTALVGVQGVLTVTFVLVHFEVPRRRGLLGGLALVFVLVAWLSPERQNLEGVWILTIAIGVSLAGAAWAAWRRRRGAWPAVIGVAASAILLALEAEDYRASFFLKFLPALVGLISALALQLRDERQKARNVHLSSARLELELLKKNLQPHYLLNTLTTIVEVIEQEPKTAVTLIEALAREFRILARVAGAKLIPLGHELELCRAHLRIMSLRKGAQCSLAVAADTDERALVPPALFHTLVENGLTHLLPRDGEQPFELSMTRDPGRVRYTLVAHGDPSDRERSPTLPPLKGSAGPVPEPPAVRREGTGLRYVKARLEESFPGRWSLQGEAIPDGWRTMIEIESAEQAGVRGTGRPA